MTLNLPCASTFSWTKYSGILPRITGLTCNGIGKLEWQLVTFYSIKDKSSKLKLCPYNGFRFYFN